MKLQKFPGSLGSCKAQSLARLSAAVLFLCAGTIAFSQISDANNNLPPFGSFHGSDFDIVNLNNGNLHLSIPVLTVQQRGKPFQISYTYDTQEFLIRTNQTPTGTTFSVILGSYNGWNRTDSSSWGIATRTGPSTNCPSGGGTYKLTTYSVVSPDRAKHATPVQVSQATGQCSITIAVKKGPATDGSGAVLDINGATPTVTLKDGTSATDTNGNVGDSFTDSLNRHPVVVTNAPNTTLMTPMGGSITSSPSQTWTITDANGASQTWRVDYTAVDMTTGLCGTRQLCGDFNHIKIVPQSLTLPTGKSYQFTWFNNSQAEIQRIDLPTGGSVAYTYTTKCSAAPPVGDAPSDLTCRRAVISRTVTQAGTPATWTYNGNRVTDPNGNDEVHTFGVFVDPTTGDTSDQSVEKEVDFWSGSSVSGGTLLKKVVNTYSGTDNQNLTVSNVRLIQVDTTENGVTKRVQTDYEGVLPACSGCAIANFASNPIETREYDWGTVAGTPGPLLRRTTFTYLHTGNQAYIDRNIVNPRRGHDGF